MRRKSFMHNNQPVFLKNSLLFCMLLTGFPVFSQMITGTWKGRINRQKVELKIIQKGDSLTGTSYYYESPNHYRRYAIKGYFDPGSNEAVWWDDRLIEEKTGKLNLSSPGKIPLLSSADFNCPGDGRMMLDGRAALKENPLSQKGEVHLDKTGSPVFADEWDYVIDNYMWGTNDPEFIDSIAGLVSNPIIIPESVSPAPQKEPLAKVTPPVKKQPVKTLTAPQENKEPPPVISTPVQPLTIEQKFTKRKNVLTTEIPLSGDSLELRFYDNAEIDGDSISLFLNGKLIFSHIRLAASAYTIKLSVHDLNETNELVMVAENLGAIPPNTSYMVALCGEKRYEARLESTEGSSAMIRLFKPPTSHQ